MDRIIITEVMGGPSLKYKEYDDVGCCATQKDEGEVTIKKETECDQEEFNDSCIEERESTDNPECVSLFKGDPPELKVFLEKENPVDNGYEEKNSAIVNCSSAAEEESLELKEEIKLEDIEFQSVGTLSSTGMVCVKTEEYDCGNLFREERMNFPIVTDDSVTEEDPLELKNLQERVTMERIRSTRGFIYTMGGYIYLLYRSTPNSVGKIYLRCSREQCSSRVAVSQDGAPVGAPSQHNHPPDEAAVDVYRFRNALLQLVAEDLQRQPRELYDLICDRFPRAAPLISFRQVRSSIYRRRLKRLRPTPHS